MDNLRLRVFAVDWLGRKRYASNYIWLAEVDGGQLSGLEAGRSREELSGHLIEMGRADPNIVVGLDFAFSMPEWFSEALCLDRRRILGCRRLPRRALASTVRLAILGAARKKTTR